MIPRLRNIGIALDAHAGGSRGGYQVEFGACGLCRLPERTGVSTARNRCTGNHWRGASKSGCRYGTRGRSELEGLPRMATVSGYW